MAVDASAQLAGRRYQLVEQLGAGSMGVVFRAIDRLTGHTVALKRVMNARAHLAFNPDTDGTNMRLALAREFQVLASLRHPNIISVLDYGFDDARQPYFTMELLEDARNVQIAAQGQTLIVQVGLVLQMLQALVYLHRRGVLHRDLKPANILTTLDSNRRLQVKLMDFGLSIFNKEQIEDDTAGTLNYMAPEVLQGYPSSESADLYAVGVIAYEILTGHYPFDGRQTGSMLNDILTAAPIFPPEMNAGVAAVLERLLAKTPDVRYTSAGDVIRDFCNALALPRPPETEAIRESFLQAASFVGRDKELATLTEAYQMAVEGRGSAWLVGGESGVGKSRLLDELRIFALVKGALVLRGQAVSAGSAPYQLWRSGLQWLALLADLTPREASILKPVVPAIESLLGYAVLDAADIDPRSAQARLLHTVADILKRRAQTTVILLEDLQWSDPESLALLQWLNGLVTELPLLVIGTYRNDEEPDLPGRLPGMQHIDLRRLKRAAIVELSAQFLGEVGRQPGLVEFLRRETEGNVFFLVEVVRALAEEAGQLEGVGQMILPEHVLTGGVQRIVQRRLSRVAEMDRPLLRLAAVAGRQIDPALLHVIQPDAGVERWLERCAGAAVLDLQEGRWRFAHDKLRDGVLAELTRDERARLHREVAAGLESLYRGAPEYVSALAYHWALGGDREREVKYAILAGEQALSSSAFQKAQTYFERALAIEKDFRAVLGDHQRSRLRLQYGETCYGLGDYARAVELLQDSARLAERGGSSEVLAHALNILGNIALALGDLTEAQRLLQRSLDVSTQAGLRLHHGRALRSLGVVTETLGTLDEAKRLYQQSLSLLDELNDPLGVAGALANLATVARAEGDYERARTLYRQSLAQFEMVGFSWGIAFTLTSLGLVLEALDEYAEASQLHERAVVICREIGHRWGTAFCLNNYANACFALQRYTEMRTAIIEALQVAVEIQTLPMALDVVTTYARLMVVAGAPGYATELLAFVLAHPLREIETMRRAEALLAGAQQQLSEAVFDSASARGRTLEFEAVVADILQPEAPPAS